MFNHLRVKLPEITATTTDGVRLYETPEGNKYPSITTVLSIRNKKGLHEWRKRVGYDVANYVARTAASRGTKVHHMCEDYLNNVHVSWPEKWKEHEKHFLPYCLFNQLKEQALCNINGIYAQEAGLYSDKYKVAGRVDCIAEFNGELAVIDFKTSTKEKKEDHIENYFVQETAYAAMFLERSGIEVKKIVTLIATEEGSIQVFEKYNLDDYLQLLKSYIEEFVRGRNA